MDSERRLFKMQRWMVAALSVKSVEGWFLFIAWKLTSTSGADKTWFGQKNRNKKKTKIKEREKKKRKKRKNIQRIEPSDYLFLNTYDWVLQGCCCGRQQDLALASNHRDCKLPTRNSHTVVCYKNVAQLGAIGVRVVGDGDVEGRCEGAYIGQCDKDRATSVGVEGSGTESFLLCSVCESKGVA